MSYNPNLNYDGRSGSGERSPYDIEGDKHKRKMPNYRNSKNRFLNFIYKLFLNLFSLSLIGVMIWSGIKLFSQHAFLSSQTIGSIVFIVEVIVFLVVARLNFKTRRQPNMPITMLTLGALFLVFAFAGVAPISTYKNNITDEFESIKNSQWFQGDNQPSKTQSTTTSQQQTKTPHGTYTGVAMGITATLTFNGSTLTTYDPLDGKQIYTYTITPDGSTITYTSVATGNQITATNGGFFFTYIYAPQYDIVTWNGTQYYK